MHVVRRFLLSKTPERHEASAALRFVYLTAFLGQCLFVGLTGTAVWLLAGRHEGSSPLVGQALLILSLVELPVALVVAHLIARPGGKGGALSGVIALGVILATPAWLALFAWLVGSAGRYLLLILLVLALSYTVGFLRLGAYVGMALTPQARPEERHGDGSGSSA